MFVLNLYKRSAKKQKPRYKRSTLFIKLVSLIKKYFIDKEKSRTVTKVKIRKFKKHNIQQLSFGTLALASHCYCENKA